ncbi:MAG: hypothetical protein MUF64_16345 [Polyangiaceae bacterium]|jgi:ppGpp synthetase/RelA/SpoT-type nucleotidyltranferase|nr:hypothetical protein [Polyangiaceae bacterium]
MSRTRASSRLLALLRKPAFMLTDPQIDELVRRYSLQMARFEESAHYIEDQLRRELRANAIKALLSSRAKHPEDLRGKLQRKRGKAEYVFAALDHNIGALVTDLAGCRVLVYDRADIDITSRLVKQTCELALLPSNEERHDKDSGYKANHFLVQVPTSTSRQSLYGTVVEVQVTSLVMHAFAEVEHDILYKDHGVPASPEVRENVGDIRSLSWILDRTIGKTLAARTREMQAHRTTIMEAADLRFALEQEVGRRLSGDFVRLFRWLSGTLAPPMTLHAIHELGRATALLEAGRALAQKHGVSDDDLDDVVLFVLALIPSYPEIREMAAEARGRSTALKRAVLRIPPINEDTP